MRKLIILTGITGTLFAGILIFDSVNAKDVQAPLIQAETQAEDED
ncbi:hypothetical protein SAMN05216238_10894 [Lentibacillus persicus]|uniref:Uncharacterized protein n=1 Tax=Lentibacillus persicus TaxID=640948 RepID=A0A1I1XU20_9BACI|nr:hypothetical protein [Lentibacillus persicus]SFE10148.1 hypothetical protein SAMN05216238_10894 [Lentibacillus persicus]